MDVYNFQPNHLLEYELDYELKIRLLTSHRTVADKRKIFSRIQKREQSNPGKDINLEICTLSFEEEKAYIQRSMDSIQKVIDEFEGNTKDSAFNRVKSRLAHVIGRARRIPMSADEAEAAEISKYIQDTTATCLLLESNLYDKITPGQEPEPLVSNAPVINVAAPIVQCASRSIPVSEWNVTFDGNSKKLYPFLERLTELALARNVSYNDLFNSAAEFFIGDAFVWYRSVKSSLNDWDSLIIKLKHDFLHDDIDDDLWEHIKKRKQKKHESTVVFIAHLEALFSRLSRPPAEISKVKHIRKNLLPEFISRLALIDINTVSELSELCRKLEESDYIKDKSRPRDEVAGIDSAGNSQRNFKVTRSNHKNNFNKNFKNNSYSSNQSGSNQNATFNKNHNLNKNSKEVKTKTSVVCWNCKLPNHTYLDCRASKSIFCFKCGEANVKVSTCPKCSKN